MMDEVDPTHKGKITFEMFKKLMNEDSITHN
jgi:Ca2+-binding EF-hand superfamily protein